MKIKILIATADPVYNKLISDNISEYHSDMLEVSDCSAQESFNEAVSKKRYDVALLDTMMLEKIDLNMIQLPLVLCSEHESAANVPAELGKIRKHQRISSIVAAILERYAKISGNRPGFDSKSAVITAVWSPAGGAGKTTVALAYAASVASKEKEVFYLNLEDFSSVSGYFSENGKSISTVFEMLDSRDSNIEMLVQGICCYESGITYLCSPDNFDDMCILSSENINDLIVSCAGLADELVIDLSSAYDVRTRKAFETAQKIFIVTEPTIPAEAKLTQFTSQNDVFDNIKDKTTLVANKGGSINGIYTDSLVSLPFVDSNNTMEVYKKLSASNFDV